MRGRGAPRGQKALSARRWGFAPLYENGVVHWRRSYTVCIFIAGPWGKLRMNNQRYCNILACGPFSTGKSTFLNRLFRMENQVVSFGGLHSAIIIIDELFRVVD